MIIGRIQDTLNLVQMESKWQQKKQTLGTKGQKTLTAEERQLQMLQEQAEDMQESNEFARIDAKIKSGRDLTPKEKEYLREHNPEALKEYERAVQEEKAYEKRLKNCKTKEEVDQVKIQKIGSFLSQLKKVDSNPNIPKAQKMAILGYLQARIAKVNKVHLAFVKSLEYQKLPTEEEKKAQEQLEDGVVTQTDSKDETVEVSEEQGEVTEEQVEVTEAQGAVTEAQGEVTEAQGKVTEEQGEVIKAQGEVAKAQAKTSKGQIDGLEEQIEESIDRWMKKHKKIDVLL